uniref:Uncharacterized protein n=1 Tax=Cucumis sativus TaxID=3659 RepID=A0A0A0LH14_CUCSA
MGLILGGLQGFILLGQYLIEITSFIAAAPSLGNEIGVVSALHHSGGEIRWLPRRIAAVHFISRDILHEPTGSQKPRIARCYLIATLSPGKSRSVVDFSLLAFSNSDPLLRVLGNLIQGGNVVLISCEL